MTEGYDKDDQSIQYEAVLFTGYNKQNLAQFGVEAQSSAVLDSACSSTVCGEVWMDNILTHWMKKTET